MCTNSLFPKGCSWRVVILQYHICQQFLSKLHQLQEPMMQLHQHFVKQAYLQHILCRLLHRHGRNFDLALIQQVRWWLRKGKFAPGLGILLCNGFRYAIQEIQGCCKMCTNSLFPKGCSWRVVILQYHICLQFPCMLHRLQWPKMQLPPRFVVQVSLRHILQLAHMQCCNFDLALMSWIWPSRPSSVPLFVD